MQAHAAMVNTGPSRPTTAPCTAHQFSTAQRKTTSLSVFFFNARSLLPKMSELRTITSSLQPDIVAVTETWLSPSVPDGAVLLPNYNTVVRTDRQSFHTNASGQAVQQRGGGVLLLIHDSLTCIPRSDLQIWPESCWIEINIRKSTETLLVGCMYRPPSSDVHSFTQDLEACFENVDLQRSHVVLVGDFNAKSPSWLASDNYSAAGHALEPTFLQLGLHQCVSSPTHINQDGSLGSLLDLALTSSPSLISAVTTHPPLGSSDHLSVLCKLALGAVRMERGVGRRIWSYDKMDLQELNKALTDADWSTSYNAPDVDSAISSWTSTFFGVVNKHIPSKFIKTVKSKNPFVTPGIAAAIKEKRAALRIFKKNATGENRDNFKAKRNLVTHLLRKSERAYATSLLRESRLQSSPSTSKNFWQHMKVVQGKVKKMVIPDLKNSVNKTVARCPAEKAQLLNNFFCEQTVLRGATLSTSVVRSLKTNDRKFDTLRTTPREIYDVLSRLKVDKAPGNDGIPPRLLRICASGISTSLSAVFNRSFASASFPTMWKDALVVPIFKKGDRSSPGNYRPIALLPILSKVIERIVYNKLSHFLKSWLVSNQSGFKRSDGTIYQLIRLTQEWSDAVDNGQYVASVFFDLRKAFDRVWHRGLLAKLQAAGIQGTVLQWFASFLSGRRQATLVDGSISPYAALHAGVPQGAILSPILFLIYMNDIPFGRSTNLFADDTSSFVIDKSPSAVCDKLQDRADALCRWFKLWMLSVNELKTAVMIFRSSKMQPVVAHILIDSLMIPHVSSHRHLGVTFNETLSWSDHVDNVISSASAKIGFLRRLRNNIDQLVLRELYCVCIRPAMEYASLVWAGLTKTEANRLEKCNRSAARVIAKVSIRSDLPRQLLLARAGLDTLQERRNVAQVKLCIRACSATNKGRRLPDHLQSAISSWMSMPSKHSMENRTSCYAVRLPRPNKDTQRNSPLYSAFSIWNSLPIALQKSPTHASISLYFSS